MYFELNVQSTWNISMYITRTGKLFFNKNLCELLGNIKFMNVKKNWSCYSVVNILRFQLLYK